MLRLLSIRNFAVVAALEVEFDRGFTVLTGETGAGKSLLLDALSLLLGDRFEARQLPPLSEVASKPLLKTRLLQTAPLLTLQISTTCAPQLAHTHPLHWSPLLSH